MKLTEDFGTKLALFLVWPILAPIMLFFLAVLFLVAWPLILTDNLVAWPLILTDKCDLK